MFNLPGCPAISPDACTDLGVHSFKRADGTIVWTKLEAGPTDDGYYIHVADITGLIEERERIAYAETIWRYAIQAAGHGVWEYNALTDRRFYCDEWRRMRGFPADFEVCDTIPDWKERLHPDDIDDVMAHVEEHNSGRRDRFSFEYREQRLDGRWMWVLARGRAVAWDENGVPTRLIGTDIDITGMKEEEARRAEEVCLAHERHLAELAEAHAATEAARKVSVMMARKDSLSGLPNRRAFTEEIRRMIKHDMQDQPGRCAVMLIDLDRFKTINDGLGHAVGDFVIRQTTARLKECAVDGAMLARLGGDEFGLVMPIDPAPDAAKIAMTQARELLQALHKPISLGDIDAEVGASIGIALYPDHGQDADALIRHADIAMYDVKQNGRGAARIYSPEIGTDAEARIRLMADVRRAVVNEEIKPFFQPVIDIASGNVAGFEVLARWAHPQYGMIAPDRFLPIVEQAGLMGELTESLLRRSCNAALAWPNHISIAINVSANEVCNAALARKILSILADCGFPANRLGIEITEQALVKDFASAKKVTSALREAGVKILLDDFGTGYSSLGYLKDLAFDCLKIDRSFIAAMTKQEESAKIVDAILALAGSLGIRTVAEGLEDFETAQTLLRMGCHLGQGYYYARAMPAADVSGYIRQSLPLRVSVG